MSTGSGSADGPVVWIGVHDLGRTGVPIVLLRYLRALPEQHRRRVHVVAMRGGDLAHDLRPWCATLTQLEPAGRRSAAGAAAVGLEVAGAPRAGALLRRGTWSLRLARLPRPDVVVLHGAGAVPLRGAVPGDPPTVLHLHELEIGLDRSVPVREQANQLSAARLVMAVSRPVADLALARGGDARRLELVPGVVDRPAHDHVAPPSAPDGLSWVMGGGAPGWRKGTDRLAALAHPLARSRPAVRVGWVGGRPVGADATAVGAVDPVHWFDAVAEPWELLRRSRVIVVPSREDALPLVALEAGIRARPVVAFRSGGLVDLLAEGRGAVGERPDVAWMLAAVEQLLDDEDRAAETGRRLAEHVEAHHLAAKVVPRWWELIVDAAGR